MFLQSDAYNIRYVEVIPLIVLLPSLRVTKTQALSYSTGYNSTKWCMYIVDIDSKEILLVYLCLAFGYKVLCSSIFVTMSSS